MVWLPQPHRMMQNVSWSAPSCPCYMVAMHSPSNSIDCVILPNQSIVGKPRAQMCVIPANTAAVVPQLRQCQLCWLCRVASQMQGYTLEQAAAHNHYVTGKDTLYHFEPRQDRWESQRDWWVPTVLGLHPIKEQGNFTACFQHYRLDLVRQQHCYHTNIRKPLGDRIAACSRPLPDLRVRDEYDHRYHLSMLPPEALAAVLKSQKHDDKAKQSVV